MTVEAGGQRRPTVMFVVGPAFGHFGRALMLARAMADRRSLEIFFVQPEREGRREPVVDLPFECLRVPVDSSKPDHLMFSTALSRIMSERSVDLVVRDLSPTQWLPTASFGEIPTVQVTNIFLTPHAQLETLQSTYFARYGANLNADRRAGGLSPITDGLDLYEADLLVIADPVQIVERFAPLPSHYFASGPFYWSPSSRALPAELRSLQDLLLVSMGTTGGRQLTPSLTGRLKEWLGASAVVSCNARLSPSEQARSGADYAFRWLEPLGDVMDRARAVLTHGGAGSSYEALAHGVPLLFLPSHANNRHLAALTEACSAGLDLSGDAEGKLRGASLAEMVSSAQAISDTIDCERSAAAAAERSLGLLRGGRVEDA